MSKNLLFISLSLITFALLVGKVSAEDQGDWVNVFDLPIGFPVHYFYAGYLNITTNKALYYTYFPSESNPSRDPLIIRLSPGPGCSSLWSSLYSNGPFVFVKNSTEFRFNPYNWNKNANLLFIEGPAGVGFSTSDQTTLLNDAQTVFDYFKGILKFYQKFPQLKDQNVYLNGNHYAGVIIPYLARQIVQLNAKASTPSSEKIRLKGIFLENPCTLEDDCDSHFEYSGHTVNFLKNHYFLSQQDYNRFRDNCGSVIPTPQCQEAKLNIMAKFKNTGSDIHNIFIECLNQGHESLYPCLDLVGINSFFTSEHVKQDMNANVQTQWEFCNKTILQRYERDPRGSYHIYQTLLAEENSLKIWIVSGVFNGLVPTMGTKGWIQRLKYDLGLQTLRVHEPWMYNKTINGGSIQQLRGISFVSVRSAGYNIFMDQPQLGFHVLQTFLDEKGRL